MPLNKHEREQLNTELACIFSKDARLLWRSPAWTGGTATPSEEHRLLGDGWREFIVTQDEARLLRWLASPDYSAEVFFCCVPPSNNGQPVRCCWVKRHHRLGWVTLGKVVDCRANCECAHTALPAPPCIVGDLDVGGGGLKKGIEPRKTGAI